MNAELIRELKAMRPQIRARWEALLRLERVHTPLANPDTLVFMFDPTLDSVLAALPGHPVRSAGPRPTCRYANNPVRVYFTALEQALLEALILAQSSQVQPQSVTHAAIVAERMADVTELSATVRRVARNEIRTLDQVCQPQVRRRKSRA
jgi:hypothetical protein